METDDAALPLIACDTDGKNLYLLGPAFIDGSEIERAEALLDSRMARYVVDVTFKSAAADRFNRFTAANLNRQLAFAVDSTVLSAPQIMSVMTGPETQISGGTITKDSARELANTLQCGALPLSFTAA